MVETAEDLIRLKVPSNMPSARYRAPREVEVPAGAEVPMFDPSLPEDRQLQEVWHARVRMFTLPADEEELQKVWQMVTDGTAQMCENQTHFDTQNGVYRVFMRWAEIQLALPQAGG